MATFTYNEGDVAPSIIDAGVKIILGISGFAIMFAILFLLTKVLGFNKKGREPPQSFGGKPGLNFGAI